MRGIPKAGLAPALKDMPDKNEWSDLPEGNPGTLEKDFLRFRSM